MCRYRKALEELLKKQSMAEECTSSLTQYPNKCHDVMMDGPVFCLACQSNSFCRIVKVKAEILFKDYIVVEFALFRL